MSRKKSTELLAHKRKKEKKESQQTNLINLKKQSANKLTIGQDFFKRLIRKMEPNFKEPSCYKWAMRKLKKGDQGIMQLFRFNAFNKSLEPLMNQIEELYFSKQRKHGLPEIQIQLIDSETQEEKKLPEEPKNHPENEKINLQFDESRRSSIEKAIAFESKAANPVERARRQSEEAQIQALCGRTYSFQDPNKPTSEEAELTRAIVQENFIHNEPDCIVGALKHIDEKRPSPFYEEIKKIFLRLKNGETLIENAKASMINQAEQFLLKQLETSYGDSGKDVLALIMDSNSILFKQGSQASEICKTFRRTGVLGPFEEYFSQSLALSESQSEKTASLLGDNQLYRLQTFGPNISDLSTNPRKSSFQFQCYTSFGEITDSEPKKPDFKKTSGMIEEEKLASSKNEDEIEENMSISDAKRFSTDSDESVSTSRILELDITRTEPQVKRKVIRPNMVRKLTQKVAPKQAQGGFSMRLTLLGGLTSAGEDPEENEEKNHSLNESNIPEDAVRELLPQLTMNHRDKIKEYNEIVSQLTKNSYDFTQKEKRKIHELFRNLNPLLLEQLDRIVKSPSNLYQVSSDIKSLLPKVNIHEISMITSAKEKASRLNRIEFLKILDHMRQTMGILSEKQYNVLRYLFGKEDIATIAAYEVYMMTRDMEDFKDSLLLIERIKFLSHDLGDYESNFESLEDANFKMLDFLHGLKKYLTQDEESILELLIIKNESKTKEAISFMKSQKVSKSKGVARLRELAKMHEALWRKFMKKETREADQAKEKVESRCDTVESVLVFTNNKMSKKYEDKKIKEFLRLTQEDKDKVVIGIWEAYEGNKDKADLAENLEIWCNLQKKRQVGTALIECFEVLEEKFLKKKEVEELQEAILANVKYEKHLNDIYQVYKLMGDDGDFLESVKGILEKK